jgi:hypothetical protein
MVIGGWLLACQALAARGDAALAPKVITARFYCEQLLPQSIGLTDAVTAGSSTLLSLTPEQLASR